MSMQLMEEKAVSSASEDIRSECRVQLEEMLLAIGGHKVHCLDGRDNQRVLDRGFLMKGKVQKWPGRPNSCHTNASAIWGTDVDDLKLCTGYSLSQDGIWFEHSWVHDGMQIIESTVKRTRYYGFIMTDDEAFQFWFANYLSAGGSGPIKLMVQAVSEHYEVTPPGPHWIS